MVEDPIEKERCIICGKETERVWEAYPPTIRGVNSENVPICGGCQATTKFSEVVKAVEKYKERRDGVDIGRTIALELKKRGYEHYRGQDVQGAENRFFIKGERLIQVIVEEWADEEILENIKNGAANIAYV